MDMKYSSHRSHFQTKQFSAGQIVKIYDRMDSCTLKNPGLFFNPNAGLSLLGHFLGLFLQCLGSFCVTQPLGQM